jgi:hypothetical protein
MDEINNVHSLLMLFNIYNYYFPFCMGEGMGVVKKKKRQMVS